MAGTNAPPTPAGTTARGAGARTSRPSRTTRRTRRSSRPCAGRSARSRSRPTWPTSRTTARPARTRDAERANLLVEIPKLAAAEAKLARLVAVSDDVDALVTQLKLTQAERKAAEARVAELEGIELDIRASRDQVEKLKQTWGEWSKLLAAHDASLPDGTYGAALAARSFVRSSCRPSSSRPSSRRACRSTWRRSAVATARTCRSNW